MHTSVPQVGRGSWQTTRKDIMIKYSPYWIQDVFNPNIHSSWKHSFQWSILTTYTKIPISKIKYYGNCFITSHWDQQKIKNHNLLYTLFLYTNLLKSQFMTHCIHCFMRKGIKLNCQIQLRGRNVSVFILLIDKV